jgi:hypothetical protein
MIARVRTMFRQRAPRAERFSIFDYRIFQI